MAKLNQIDAVDISNLGIAFETEEEMKEFVAIVDHELELRIGAEIMRAMSPRQRNELESVVDRGKDEFVGWMNENFPQHIEICHRVKTGLKNELLKYRDEI